MFALTKPSAECIQRFLDTQRGLSLSYAHVGATNGTLPAGYNIDHNRIQLGYGEQAFRRAIHGVRNWKMHDLGWLELCWPNAPIEVGSTVAVLGNHFGFWSCHPAKIVYVIDEAGEHSHRFGFGYGTLPAHDEIGEERFLIEWQLKDDSVWYDILAFSRPASMMARLGYPLVRMLQKRFGKESKDAMLRAVAEPSATK